MKINGRAYRLPTDVFNDVNTDVIIAGRYLRLPEGELCNHAFEGIIPDFSKETTQRSIMVAGKNMGCGSSREQAPKALIGNGVKLIIAASYGYIFYRNAINLGLVAVTLQNEDDLKELTTDADITVDLGLNKVQLSSGKEMAIKPLPPRILDILEAGGLLPSLTKSNGAP